MSEKPIVSLCIPTNGVVEWVFPVLDSIINQNVDSGLYEIIVTDNGNNQEFKKKIKEYKEIHPNIVYAETSVSSFSNQTEAYKLATGCLIKFVNHRMTLVEGALEKLITFALEHTTEKPIVYFSNGVLHMENGLHMYDSFNQFVKGLSYYSSWSAGMAIWKDDFDSIPVDTVFNELFPHTTVLFYERKRGCYLIDNTPIMKELPTNTIAKGNYDLFRTFGIEYPGIICDLLREKSISENTFRFVVNQNLEFIAELYFDFCIRKLPCSYDLTGFNNIFGIFYTKSAFRRQLFICIVKKITAKCKRKLLR